MADVAVKEITVPKDATPANRPDLFGTRGQIRPDGNGGISSAMAADRPEYATPDVSQVDSGFYVGDRGLPWHVSLARFLNFPELMADAGKLLTTAEAIAIGGFDFEVEKQPLAPLGSQQVFPNRWATVRTDTGAPLGVVGPTYKVAQNAEAFGFLDAVVDSGEAKWETAGVMRGGSWTFASLELDHLGIIVPGDPSDLKTYLLIINSFDGSRKLGGYVTRVRTVCKNTSELAKKGAVSRFEIKHSGTLDGKIAAAREALGIAFKNTEMVRELTEQLATTKLLDRQVRDIFEKAVWPLEDDLTETAKEKHHSQQAFALYLASPNLEGIRGTAWGMYNAVTEYLDWGVKYASRTRGDDADARADSLLFGHAKDLKDRALDAALAKAK